MRARRFAAAKEKPAYGQPVADPYVGFSKSVANYYRATVGGYLKKGR